MRRLPPKDPDGELKISAWKFTVAQDDRVRKLAEIARCSKGKMYRTLLQEALDAREGTRAEAVGARSSRREPAAAGLDRPAWEPPTEDLRFTP